MQLCCFSMQIDKERESFPRKNEQNFRHNNKTYFKWNALFGAHFDPRHREMMQVRRMLYAREAVSVPHRKSHGTAVQQDCSRLQNVI